MWGSHGLGKANYIYKVINTKNTFSRFGTILYASELNSTSEGPIRHVRSHISTLWFLGFPMNVIAILPYMVEHYAEPNQICIEAAEHISQV